MKPVLVLVGCATAHLARAMISPSPWWVPDLTLVGLILSVGRAPARWLAFSVLAGLLTAVWAVRFPGQLVAGYLLIGWVSQLLSRHWDAADLRIECLYAAAGSLFLMVGMLWLSALWSGRLLAFKLFRAAVTCGAVPLVHHMASWGPPVVRK